MAPVHASRALGNSVPAGHPPGALLAQEWWTSAIRGLLCILFGVTALLPAVTMRSLIYVFAAYSALDGVFAMVCAVRAARSHRHWELRVLEGGAGLSAAVFICLAPGVALSVLVFLIGAWALVSGLLMFRGAFAFHIEHGRYWLALGGVASMVVGGILVASPLVGASVPPWMIGGYALVFGAVLLGLSFMLRARTAVQPASRRRRTPALRRERS
jgi:uncharacterized membrane protein HdeD (DUF308 family)